jgi:hypothetical protein
MGYLISRPRSFQSSYDAASKAFHNGEKATFIKRIQRRQAIECRPQKCHTPRAPIRKVPATV